MTQDEAKWAVALRAVTIVEDGMRVGLGTGTTATMFIRALAERVREEKLQIRCVASSDASAALAESLGLQVTGLDELPELDVYVDGADEVSLRTGGVAGSGLDLIRTDLIGIDLIKGGGGALLREKIVASAARRFVVVVDQSKLVPCLGRFPLPVEVIKMALPLVEPKLEGLALHPALRMARGGGEPYLTDEGNYILDCACERIDDPERTASAIRAIVGVVEHGLFLGMAERVLIAGEDGVVERRA